MAHEIAPRGRARARGSQRRAGRRNAFRQGAAAARDAVATKVGFGSEESRIANAPYVGEAADAALEAADAAALGLTHESLLDAAVRVGGDVGYAEGVLTANDALGTSYTVAEIRGARFGGGANRDRNGNRRAALGEGRAEEKAERGALGAAAAGGGALASAFVALAAVAAARRNAARGDADAGLRERLVGARAGRAYGGLLV